MAQIKNTEDQKKLQEQLRTKREELRKEIGLKHTDRIEKATQIMREEQLSNGKANWKETIEETLLRTRQKSKVTEDIIQAILDTSRRKIEGIHNCEACGENTRTKQALA